MNRQVTGTLVWPNAYLAIVLSLMVLSAAVASRKSHHLEPPNLSHMPTAPAPRVASSDIVTKQPQIIVTPAPGWTVVTKSF
jgi:hypothetical protein